MLTLLGPGGIGKTRLAIEIGKNQTNEFPQGVFFIPLSTLEDRQSFAPAITRAMGLTLRQHGPTPEEQLLDFLREKRLLIILDSFEKMVQWASLLTEIHSHAFGVKILITSRHRLHLQGEWVMEVKGLDFPPEQSKKASVEIDEDIKFYSAVDLFLQASHRALVTFQAQPEDIVAISRITQLLEGMPLGIELAATWVNTLSCQDITQEISRGLDILEASVVDLPERQRSLRAVFDYSWDLLSNREQVLLPRLAVFKGSFSRQTAEQVVGISLHELSCLVDKSLVRRTPQGWFDLHDLLHQYCAERLEQLPADDQETHRRHCAYFSARQWDWNRQLSGERQGEVMREIELELANIKAAWDWAVYQKRLDFLEQIVDGLCTFLLRRGRFTEGLDTCLKTIEAIQGVTSVDDFARQARLSIRLLTWEASLNMNLERFEEAKQSIQESLRILDDPRLDPSQVISERIFTLIIQGLLANLGYDPIPLIEIYEEAFQLSRDTKTETPRLYIYFWRFLMGGGSVSKELYMQMAKNLASVQQDGDPFELGCYLFVLGIAELYHYYRMENAEPLLRESVNKFQVVDDPTTQVMIFKTLGYLLSVQGEFEENLILKQSELEIYQDIGDRRMIGIAHVEIGEILYHQGDYAKAEEQIRTGLVIVKELSDYEYALRHRYLGDVLLVQGKYEEAQTAYQYSCQFFHSKNDKGWIFTALTGLSRTELALGAWQAAWDHAAQALQLYTEVQLYTFFAYLIVAEIALLLATRGEVAHALELYCLVLRQGYLAHSRWFADLFGRLIEEAAAQLPAEEYSEAKKRGEQLKFPDTIARLLNIMKDNDFERQ